MNLRKNIFVSSLLEMILIKTFWMFFVFQILDQSIVVNFGIKIFINIRWRYLVERLILIFFGYTCYLQQGIYIVQKQLKTSINTFYALITHLC